MNTSVEFIPVANLALTLVPVFLVLGIMFRWSLNSRGGLYSVVRMFLQLLAVGYVLAYIFQSDQVWLILLVLASMLLVASWIAIRPVRGTQPLLYLKSLASISAGGISTLLLVTQAVLTLEPWFLPRYMIPLAGMIFANSMNAVSLVAERFQAETNNSAPYARARSTALNAALIPSINSLLAVGLVALPGMMTGQILSGVSPLIAARYQIMVMCMLFGAAGISAACYLVLVKANRPAEQASVSQ